MNNSAAVFLVDENVELINVKIDNGEHRGLILSYKNNDQKLEVGDLVVVPVRNKFATGEVVEKDVEINFDSSFDYRWIVGKVDLTEFEAKNAKEAEIVEKVRKADRMARRKKLAEDLLGSVEGLENTTFQITEVLKD